MRCKEQDWPRDIKVFLENSRSIPCREYLQVTDYENRIITTYLAFRDGEIITPRIVTADVPIYGYRVEYLVDGLWRGSQRSVAGAKHCLKDCYQGRIAPQTVYFGHIQPVPLQSLFQPEPANMACHTQPGNIELGCLEVRLYLDYTEATHGHWSSQGKLPWYFRYHQDMAMPELTDDRLISPTYCIEFKPLVPPPTSYRPGRHVALGEKPWATFKFLYRPTEHLEHLPYLRTTGIPKLPGTTVIFSSLRGHSQDFEDNLDTDTDMKEELDMTADVKEEMDTTTDAMEEVDTTIYVKEEVDRTIYVKEEVDTTIEVTEEMDMTTDVAEEMDIATNMMEDLDIATDAMQELDNGHGMGQDSDTGTIMEVVPDIYSDLEKELTVLERS